MVNVIMCHQRLLEPETELLMRSLLKQLLFDKNLIGNHKALGDGRLQMETERNSVCIVL